MLENALPPGEARDRQRQIAANMFGYMAEFLPGERLTRTVSEPATRSRSSARRKTWAR